MRALTPPDSPLEDFTCRQRETADTRTFDVFIAHNADDAPVVLEVCRILRHHGLRPWVDMEQIQPGTWVQEGLEAAIRAVKTAAVFLGPQGVGRWQMLETRALTERCVNENIPVIPVLLPGRDVLPCELIFLQQLHLVRFEETIHDAIALNRLMWGITGELHSPRSPCFELECISTW